MILLLGGTSESLAVADQLRQMHLPFIATVVSDYGVQLTQDHAKTVVKTTFSPESFASFCQQHDIDLVVDATHPFARVISQLAIDETAKLGISYLRFERANQYDSRAKVKMVDSTAMACDYLQTVPGKVYLSTGSKTAPEYARQLGVDRLHVRALPTTKVMVNLTAAGFKAAQIDAIQGPFSVELNSQLFKHARVQIVVTKESGRRGGVQEKLTACANLHLPCVVIRRPQLDYPAKVITLTELQEKLEEDYAG